MKRMNGKRGLLQAVALGSVLLLAVAGCKSRSDKGVNDVVVKQALVGKDGARTVSDPNTIVNTYSALAANAAAEATAVTVNAISDLATDLGTDGGLQPLAVGDLLLIIQMAGATIDTTDTATYGTVSDANLNNAGNYELAGVAGITSSTNTITLGCPLKKSYTLTGKAQVIRVAQYTTLTVAGTGSITAPAWDGTVGGVVAVHAATTLQLDGNIDVSAKGFRGGATDNASAAPGSNVVVYRSTLNTDGAEMGESIAGLPADFGTGRYGRGAPANGGGGGDSHNAGGGGGANAAASGLTWTGQGVMLGSVLGGTGAWPLDPSSGGGSTNSSGGGRGGYTYSNSNENATTTDAGAGVAPGDTLWAGDSRRQVGGLGGHPLTSSPTGRLFLGGGGGAGDGNNGHAGSGGPGGGLAFVIAGTVAGNGSILANGGNGGDADSGNTAQGDAPGGGGGGGTVVVHAGTLGQAIGVAANGGLGGDQINLNSTTEAEGPGGGGGGGYIALSGGTPTTVSASGGLGGTTTATALSEFPSNGATAGHAGVTDGSAAAILYCTELPETTIATYPTNPTNVRNGAFTFTSSNATGATFECSLDSAAYATCSATSYTTGDLSDGSHVLAVRATDVNGNVGAAATYTWQVHATGLDGGADAEAEEAGIEAGAEDAAADGEAIDGPLVIADAGAPDEGVDTSPRLDGTDGPGTVVLLDATADVAAAVDRAPNLDVPPVGTVDAAADASATDAVGLEDATGDGGGLARADAQDAQVVVVVDSRSSEAGAGPDQAVLPPPDAATTPDAAVPVGPGLDAPVSGALKVMGSGFCAVNPVRDSAPGLFTLFLVGAFGLLLLRRRRR